MTYSGHKLGDSAPTRSHAHEDALVATGSLSLPTVRPRTPRNRYFQSHPLLRRIVFVVGYESLSVLFTVVVLSSLLGHGGGTSTLTAVLVSTVATGWNYVWNTAFEALERRRGTTGRSVGSRAIHAIGYEGGVLLFTIPLVAIMLGVNLLEAFVIEGGLLVFFLVFTVVYTWIFDRAFGLPSSAAPKGEM